MQPHFRTVYLSPYGETFVGTLEIQTRAEAERRAEYAHNAFGLDPLYRVRIIPRLPKYEDQSYARS